MEQKAILHGDPVAVEIFAEIKEVLLKVEALQNAIFNSANFSTIATDAKGVIQKTSAPSGCWATRPPRCPRRQGAAHHLDRRDPARQAICRAG